MKPDPDHTGVGKQMNQERFDILEPRITSPFSEDYEFYEQGVALLIFNRSGQILLVKEAHNDTAYQRVSGQWNIVTETRNTAERVKHNIRRAIEEELASDYSQFIIIPGSYRETNGPYTECMGYLYKYRCVCLIYEGGPDKPANDVFHCDSGEILDYEWVILDDLDAYNIELGARKVIEYYRGIHA